MNLDCVFTRPEKKRGPPRGTTSKVHARLRALESLVSETLGLDPKDIDRELGLPPNRNAGANTSGARPVPARKRPHRHDSPPTSGHSDSSGSPEMYGYGASGSMLPPTPEDEDSFMLPAEATDRQFAASSADNATLAEQAFAQTFSSMPNIFQLLFAADMAGDTTDTAHSNSGSTPDTLSSPSTIAEQDMLMSSLVRYRGSPSAGTTFEYSLDPLADMFVSPASVPIIPDLIQAYFERVAPFMAILHRPSFESNPGAYPPLLLFGMYALAAQFAPILPHLHKYPSASDFFELARSKLDPFGKHDLRTLQGIMFLCKVGSGSRKLSVRECDVLLGMAVSMLRQLRLDLPEGSVRAWKYHQLQGIEALEAKRTASYVWTIDIYQKSLLDRSSSFGPEMEKCINVETPFLMETDPDWVTPVDRKTGFDPTSSVQLFLSARDTIALGSQKSNSTTVSVFTSNLTNVIESPSEIALQVHKYFSVAHARLCEPLEEAEHATRAFQDSEDLKRLLHVARVNGHTARWHLAARALTHTAQSMLMAFHGGHDFAELILDLEAGLMAVGPGGFLELGSPCAGW